LETLENVAAGRPLPILKWAGGKSQLLDTLESNFPTSFGTYFEPFLGGGAVFFRLASMGKITRAVLADLNKDLINCYVAVRDRTDQLLAQLQQLQRHTLDKRFYYQTARKRFNEIQLQTGLEGDVEKASLLLYLNKTCFNGLYRVNRKGGFNVPWGQYKNPRIYNEKNLRAVQRALGQPGVSISCEDFAESTSNAQARDFVYFDPPYHPISRTSNFTAYTAQSFGWDDQVKLAQTFSDLHRRGCYVMLSNSPRVEKLYENPDFRIQRVKATRAISCMGDNRGPIQELLVTSYQPPDL
jgi:DNA adenine methylase